MLAAMSGFVDHYAVLGVPSSATTPEIRRAYRRLVAEDHADRHGGDLRAVERTRNLNLARDVLVDPLRRARFERERRAQLPRAAASDPLFDTLARTFGVAPGGGPAPAGPDDAPRWLTGVAVGLFAAATAFSVGLSIAAAIKNAARDLRRDDA